MAYNAADSLKMTSFTAIPTRIITDPNLCAESVLVYTYLASLVGPDGTAAFPGFKKMKADLRMPNEWSPKVYVSQLEKAGWLCRWSNGKESNRYWLSVRPREFRV